MIMTEAEICKEYRESKKQNMQIGILAQLNLCKKADIIDILEKNGITVPKPAEKKQTTSNKTVTAKVVSKKPVESAKPVEVPQEVRTALEDTLDAIEAKIKDLEKQYAIISKFLCGGANG